MLTTRPAVTVGDRLEMWACWLDRRSTLIILALAGLYLTLIHHSVYRHLWYDELHTFYIAQAPSLSRFVEEIRLLDLNPPLQYALVRISFDLFGVSELTTRLPMILIYFLGSVCFFTFMRRRVGSLWAAAGVLLGWYSQFFYLSTEARPYAILIGFLGFTVMSWDYAVSGVRRGWSLIGISVGALCMILSHVFAPLWIMPLWAAEIVRTWKQRRIDWPVWMTLTLPLSACVTYLPLIRGVSGGVIPPQFLGSIQKTISLYLTILILDVTPVLVAAFSAFAIAVWRKCKAKPGFSSPDLALCLVFLLLPVLLNVISFYKHIPYYDRYASPAALMMSILILLFIAYESKVNRLSGLVATFIIFAFLISSPLLRGLDHEPFQAANQIPRMSISRTPFGQIHPELPLVINNALVFLELDHYELPDVLARLYYLADVNFALKYTNSNITEGLPVLKAYFPIRANVAPYSEFISTHRHFLVWGRMDDELGWLLRKLRADGVDVKELGDFESADYGGELYEVTLDQ